MVHFTQPVSMRVTQEQYNKDLKDSLKELGYNSISVTNFKEYAILLTNYGGVNKDLGNQIFTRKDDNSRYFIDHYNPKLFLALATMTDNKGWIKGEYLMFDDEIFKVLNINEYGGQNSYVRGSITTGCSSYNRPSKEKLINHFTKKENNINKPNMQNSLTRAQLLKLYSDFTCSTFRTAIEEILRTNVMAYDSTSFLISDNAIQRLIKEGRLEQKAAVKALGIVLEEDKSVNVTNFLKDNTIQIRSGGQYDNKSLYLSRYYNWEIKKDSYDNTCLIPTKK